MCVPPKSCQFILLLLLLLTITIPAQILSIPVIHQSPGHELPTDEYCTVSSLSASCCYCKLSLSFSSRWGSSWTTTKAIYYCLHVHFSHLCYIAPCITLIFCYTVFASGQFFPPYFTTGHLSLCWSDHNSSLKHPIPPPPSLTPSLFSFLFWLTIINFTIDL